ncbi:MAG: ABC transporter ATP-binding protein, partial [Oscillospiraceae bacterium]|nr:ABC transporter ATP-binding protein [Oscillospiraceae bacterium]
MLQLKQITKDYPAGSGTVHALRGIDLSFRSAEFVSILGPSGCGKTTLLNIMGGLDQYTSGDLTIDGVSTKNYKDRDWDRYRNHSVGFVFQSYNLIPHQSVLQNVELALSLSGVPKAERRRRAKKALEEVGLGSELRKKPGQMSGGQMQRVAIARALVNDPEIILADEPTGALDTETSVQVMDILKEISRKRLVVMVTHNPDLAEKYSTRIIRMLDGRITDDSTPLTDEELAAEQQLQQQKQAGRGRQKTPSLSFTTSFALSLKNLISKRGRTLLTAFAGSIGIIGIALIYAVSQGMTDYIDSVQEDTLSTYPLIIQSETADMASMLTAFGSVLADDETQPENTVREQQLMTQVFATIGSNDITSFKHYLEENMAVVADDINALKYSYNVSPQIYSRNFDFGVVQVNPGQLFSSAMMGSGMSMMNTEVFQEMLDNPTLLQEQYDVLAGRWPTEYNEMLLVLAEPDAIPDFLSYSLNLRDGSELRDMMQQVMAGETVEPASDGYMQWTYNELLQLTFSLVHASDRYKYNSEYAVWEDMSDDEAYMKQLITNAEQLHIVGIVSPKAGVSASAMSMGVAYLPSLREYVMDYAADAAIVRHQLGNSAVDVFSGKTFEALEQEEDTGLNFNDMISVDEQMLSEAFGMDISEDYITALMQGYMTDISSAITTDTAPAYTALQNNLTALCSGMLRSYI